MTLQNPRTGIGEVRRIRLAGRRHIRFRRHPPNLEVASAANVARARAAARARPSHVGLGRSTSGARERGQVRPGQAGADAAVSARAETVRRRTTATVVAMNARSDHTMSPANAAPTPEAVVRAATIPL